MKKELKASGQTSLGLKCNSCVSVDEKRESEDEMWRECVKIENVNLVSLCEREEESTCEIRCICV